MIEARNLTHIYNEGTAMEACAFSDISFTIEKGEFIGLIGHTGSGKSTLIQHLNGLMKPTSGTVLFEGEDIFADKYDLRKLRSKVGMVFQYPEYQLFEETVLLDVMFGPLNMGLTKEAARNRALGALKLSLATSLLSEFLVLFSAQDTQRSLLSLAHLRRKMLNN